MAHKALLVTRPREGVELITLNRPEAYNALNVQMFSELNEAVAAANEDDEVRAIVLTGAGEKAFSAGYDVKELATFNSEQQKLDYWERDQWMWRMSSGKKPLITALQGACYGGGALVAMASDIRIGCSKSTFKVTAVAYNGVNATWSLPSIVGNGLAKEWLMTGRLVTAEEAKAAGLLNHLVADDQVVEKALEIASAIAANTPAATQAVKFLIDDHIGRTRGDRIRNETTYMLTKLPPGKVSELFSKFLNKKK